MAPSCGLRTRDRSLWWCCGKGCRCVGCGSIEEEYEKTPLVGLLACRSGRCPLPPPPPPVLPWRWRRMRECVWVEGPREPPKGLPGCGECICIRRPSPRGGGGG